MVTYWIYIQSRTICVRGSCSIAPEKKNLSPKYIKHVPKFGHIQYLLALIASKVSLIKGSYSDWAAWFTKPHKQAGKVKTSWHHGTSRHQVTWASPTNSTFCTINQSGAHQHTLPFGFALFFSFLAFFSLCLSPKYAIEVLLCYCVQYCLCSTPLLLNAVASEQVCSRLQLIANLASSLQTVWAVY